MKPLRKSKSVHCRYCHMTHRMDSPTRYYCPSVFGGWVTIGKKKPTAKITAYKRALYHKLDGKWEWSCPVWFDEGIFATCTIHSAHYLETKSAAVKDMEETMKKFGVTKGTTLA